MPDFQSLDIAAQNAHAERMKRRNERLGKRRMAENPVDALRHLAGGLVGEGDGENGVGRDALFLNEPGDSAGDDAGLARAGAGKDEQRALGGFNSSALFGIQIGEERLHGGSWTRIAEAGKVLFQFTCQRTMRADRSRT